MTNKELAEIERAWRTATPGLWPDDGEDIAKAPDHIAALVAEVKRLRARLEADETSERDAASLLRDSFGTAHFTCLSCRETRDL